MRLSAKQKRAIRHRFLNFETFNGAFILVPWGAGFIYCGLYDLKMGYSYALLSVGVTLIIWGVRKASVDRIKQKAVVDKLVREFHDSEAAAPARDR